MLFSFTKLALKKSFYLIIPSLFPTLKEEKEQKFIGIYKICITFIQRLERAPLEPFESLHPSLSSKYTVTYF